MKYILFSLLLISSLSCSDSVKRRFDDHISQSDADDNIVVDIEQDNEDNDEVDVAGENDSIENDEDSFDTNAVVDVDETTDEDIVIIYCDTNPCKNGGICTDTADGYQCDCKETGFVGTNCDITPRPFITTWKTDNPGVSGNNQVLIHISVKEGTPGYSIDCDNDGVIEAEHQMTKYTCEYEKPGIYTIAITGSVSRMYFGDNAIDVGCVYPPCAPYSFDNEKLLSVEQWGDIKWDMMLLMFNRCYSLVINATDAPDLSQVTDTRFMFYMATSFNQNINHWDVSHVENMYSMFEGATSFNQDLSSWDVSHVTDMRFMFLGAKSFDQDLGSWDVSNVTQMDLLLRGTALSTENYDALLNGWSNLKLHKDIIFDVGNSMYCKGKNAREFINNEYHWSFHDGGKDPECEE